MNLHLATIILIAANILVSIKGFNDLQFFDRYKFNISAIRAGQRERTITSGFLHVDVAHLFVNMSPCIFLPMWLSTGSGPPGF